MSSALVLRDENGEVTYSRQLAHPFMSFELNLAELATAGMTGFRTLDSGHVLLMRRKELLGRIIGFNEGIANQSSISFSMM